ncbi:hypothetical protein AWN76_015145 [Rhodothermaceae bacterium RA]|nr:hypothetical protein AWN76_015145 [Rhodothermaceae bacterium RA]
MASHTAPSSQQLKIVRLALFAGQLLFGAVAWFLAGSGRFSAGMDEGLRQGFNVAFPLMAFAALGGLLLLRRRYGQSTPEQQRTYCVIGWALGEGVSLFGAVILLLGGGPLFFLAGLLLFGIAWLLLPIPSAGD